MAKPYEPLQGATSRSPVGECAMHALSNFERAERADPRAAPACHDHAGVRWLPRGYARLKAYPLRGIGVFRRTQTLELPGVVGTAPARRRADGFTADRPRTRE